MYWFCNFDPFLVNFQEDTADETDACAGKTTQSDEVVRADPFVLHEQLQEKIITMQNQSQVTSSFIVICVSHY